MDEDGKILVRCKHGLHNDIDSYCLSPDSSWPDPKCMLNGTIVDEFEMCPPLFKVSWTYYIIKKQHLIKVRG